MLQIPPANYQLLAAEQQLYQKTKQKRKKPEKKNLREKAYLFKETYWRIFWKKKIRKMGQYAEKRQDRMTR